MRNRCGRLLIALVVLVLIPSGAYWGFTAYLTKLPPGTISTAETMSVWGYDWVKLPAANGNVVVQGSLDDNSTRGIYQLGPDLEPCWFTELSAVIEARPLEITTTGIVLVSTWDDGLVAIDSDGSELWRYQPASDFDWFRAVVATASRIYAVDGDNVLYALSLEGVLIWKYDGGWRDTGKCATSTEEYTLAVSQVGEVVFAIRSFGENDPDVVAVDANGELMWRLPDKTEGHYYLCDSGFASDQIHVDKHEDYKRYLAAYNWAGEELWSKENWQVWLKRTSNTENHFTLIENNRLLELDSKGRIQWELSGKRKYLTPPYRLPNGWFIALAEGRLNHTELIKITPSGTFDGSWRLPGKFASYPTIDDAGIIYVRVGEKLLAIDSAKI